MTNVVLYRAIRGSEKYLFNSSSESVEFNFETYEPVPVRHSIRTLSASDDHLKLTMTISNNHPFAQMTFVGEDMFIQLFRGDYGMDNYVQFFQGYAISKSINFGDNTCEILIEHIVNVLSRDLLTAIPASTCQKQVYEPGCGVLFSNFKEDATVVILDGTKVTYSTATNRPVNFFAGGLARFNGEYRTIVSNTSAELILNRPIKGLKAGDVLEVARGCNRAYTTCQDVFANLVNFLGAPFIPVKNIFEEGLK